jgi:prephenate dehydrogenase
MRVAILGTGLIGGSMGLALGAGPERHPRVGYDGEPGAAERALALGAVDEVAATPEEAVRAADLVVLALPVDKIIAALPLISTHVPDGAVITDVGSAKEAVVARGEELFGGRFVGGHPMAGSEQGGIEAADAYLFEGARWLLTPTRRTDHESYARVVELVGRMGAEVVAVTPGVHDGLLARISHVPQMVAGAVVTAAAGGGDRPAHLMLAANGFRDVTRIASSPSDMWVSILKANTKAVVEGMTSVAVQLQAMADAIDEGRWDEVGSWLGEARRLRTELFVKPGPAEESQALVMLIPDRPGVLAEVTTAAGDMGANIEDLRIVHSPEGGRGRLELTVGGRERAASLSRALEGLGYHVVSGE